MVNEMAAGTRTSASEDSQPARASEQAVQRERVADRTSAVKLAAVTSCSPTSGAEQRGVAGADRLVLAQGKRFPFTWPRGWDVAAIYISPTPLALRSTREH